MLRRLLSSLQRRLAAPAEHITVKGNPPFVEVLPSGNPIAVLENVTEAQDIAVAPGAVWEVPEKARAYLLDLLQGGASACT